MKQKDTQVSASEFKKHFLQLVDKVKTKHNSYIITKHKVPVAKVIPLENENNKNAKTLFGSMRGMIKINQDIVNFSSDEDWEANK